MSWIFISANRTPNSINLIRLGYLFLRIELQILSLDMSWIFISANRTPISIHVDMSWIFIHVDMPWISIT
jgi:hypothetical protein